MTALVTTHTRRLADALAELKGKVRTALTTELAVAVGAAVRDVLLVTLVDHAAAPPHVWTPVMPRRGWRGDGYEESDRDRSPWNSHSGAWDESDDDAHARPRYGRAGEPEHAAPEPAAGPGAALAVGLTVGRWWQARGGAGAAALGFGLLATALGLTGGPLARAALAVLVAAADVLTAEAALARPDSF